MDKKKDNHGFKSLKRLLKGKARRERLVDETDADDETGSGSSGGSGSGGARRRTDDTTLPEGLPSGKRKSSYLSDDTKLLDRKRRLAEQDGHRSLAKVHARAHNESSLQQPAAEGELQNSIQQHPWLDAQRFDGIDPGLNPEPPLNTDARREFDNERREQEMEKQLRLGNMPKFSSAPKPSPA